LDNTAKKVDKMLRAITIPTVYAAGPEVFNMGRDDRAYMEAWGKRRKLNVLHPRRHSHLSPEEIYLNCVKDAVISDVLVADVNDFRGKCADDGTSIEIGEARRSGAVIIGYKEEKEDSVLRHGPRREIDGLPVDENGYFIEETGDRNVMIIRSLDALLYGPRDQVLEKIADYIDDNVRGWYRHEDPLLGRKLLPPGTKEVFETLTPNLEVDLTRFGHIIDTPDMRRLKEVKQLGALFWKYCDATHTRYAHSIMTFEFTRRMLGHLTSLTEHEKRHVLAYALLHDIGHTPYSHELEEIVDLDQMENAAGMLKKGDFREALSACDIDLDYLLTFFDKDNPNPLRQIVSDKVLGTDKLAYLLRDGIATAKGGFDNIDLIIQHTVFEDGKLGIDAKGVESALNQIDLYYSTYSATYYEQESRCNQRVFTLLGQIGMESGALPEDWYTRNDLWYDYFNIRAEELGNKELEKLGAQGIVKQAYTCAGSLRLEGAEILEDSGIHVENITEEEYAQFLSIPVKERKVVEDKICEVLGLEPLDVLIAHGGNPSKMKVKDTWVFKNGIENPIRLLEDMYPEVKELLEVRVKRQATSVRFYPRRDCQGHVKKNMDLVIKTFKEIIADYQPSAEE
jgi:HD superfamily phosphohydrolase/nucleoside 2-deoxyribosyltransferase